MSLPSRTDHVPDYLCGHDGEPPYYVSHDAAPTGDDAIRVLLHHGVDIDGIWQAEAILMRPLDPIAMKIRGVDDLTEWWVECTPRSKKAQPFWRLG